MKIHVAIGLLSLLLLSGCGGGGFAVSRSVPFYRVTELGEMSLPQMPINNRGEIAGLRENAYDLSIYRQGVWSIIENVLYSTLPDDINDAGVVVGIGYGITERDTGTVPVIFRDGTREEIYLGEPTFPRGIAINNKGQIAVAYNEGIGSRGERGLVRFEGKDTFFDFLPFVINERGEMAGLKNERPVYWDGQTLTELPIPPDDSTVLVTGINESGVIVGGGSKALMWVNGVVKDLGTFGEGTHRAIAVNNSNDVVGYSETTICKEVPSSELPGGGGGIGTRPPFVTVCEQHGFLYQDGRLIDLNERITPNSDWTITFALDINDKGQITALATKPNIRRPFYVLLTPAQTP